MGGRRVVAAVSVVLASAALSLAAATTAPPAAAAPPPYEVVQTVTLPSAPAGVAVDPSRGVVYVALRNGGQVLVLDETSLATLATITVPNEPYNLAVDPVSGYVYVSRYTGNGLQGSVSAIDPVSRTVVATVPVGLSPVGVTVSATSRRVFVGNASSSFVSVLDVTDPAAPVALPNLPVASGGTELVTESPDGSVLYVTQSNANRVAVLDATTGTTTATWTGLASVHQIVLSSDGANAFASVQLGAAAPILDVTTGTQVGTIPVANTYYQSVDRGRDTVMITAPFTSGGTVAVVDATTGALAQTVPVASAYYTATDPTRGRTFVTSISGTPRLTVIAPVVVPPVVVTDPQDAIVPERSDATFTAAATGYDTVAWERSPDGVAWTVVPGATGPTLVLPGVELADSGDRFRAVFTGEGGTVTTAPATLTVTPLPPLIAQGPADLSVPEGSDATFTASATSSTPVTVRWEESTDGGATWTPVAGAIADTLTLPAVAAAANGTLVRVVYTNEAGATTSAPATLTVTVPARNLAVALTPGTPTVAPGAEFSVTAVASNTGAATVAGGTLTVPVAAGAQFVAEGPAALAAATPAAATPATATPAAMAAATPAGGTAPAAAVPVGDCPVRDGVLACALPDLAPGDTATVTVRMRAGDLPDGTAIPLEARIAAVPPDDDPADDVARATVTVVAVPVTLPTSPGAPTVLPSPGLASTGAGPAPVGALAALAVAGGTAAVAGTRRRHHRKEDPCSTAT